MERSTGPGHRTCPEQGHRLVPIAFHPGVFEHAYCPSCDLALAWLGEAGADVYAGERRADSWKVRRIEGRSTCSRGEFRLHKAWLSRGIEEFRAGRGEIWKLCHDGQEVEPVLEFVSATEHAVKVARCAECRTYNVFLFDPLYGEEILCVFPWNEDGAPDIRKLELLPIRYHEIDAATTMAILDQVLRKLLPKA